ncbi:BCCT family transporter [Motilimonas pumila]|uniref:BCCT transporter n=1 Tax=Motilimonas pumila TaxID=2303987 RepID=A0A418YF17_9GAMM|nr:BCCT family transporter [Motilimonas pumila]RJG47725.1 BCCT transporter [Motilimonas pumila]
MAPSKTIVCCVIAAVIFISFPDTSILLVSNMTHFATHDLGLAYVLFTSFLVLVCALLICLPIGKIVIGERSQPEFSFFSWLCMLFAAGMGSGLVFWGVAEPLSHFAHGPEFAKGIADPQARVLALTYYNWGIHAWSIYAIAAVVMGWFAFNKGRSMNVSASFDANTPGIKGFDIIAVIAILFGIAGTLSNSIALVETGVGQLLPEQTLGQTFRVGILIVVAVGYTLSSVLGLNKGIKYFSAFNISFMILMLICVMIFSAPLSVLHTVFESVLSYLQLLPHIMFSIDDASKEWTAGWSVTYFLWWIAWAPFVGPFIARISRGRSIRQIVTCTVLIPTFASILWFSSFTSGVFELSNFNELVAATSSDYTQGLFMFFAQMQWGHWLSFAAVLLLVTFVISSVDSAIYVIAMLTATDSLKTKLVWSFILIALAITLLFKNNPDLNKQIAIVGAVPFTLILGLQVLAFIRSVYQQQAQ